MENSVPLWKLFKYADATDWCLVAFGTLGTIGDGISMPVNFLLISQLVDVSGNYTSISSAGNLFLNNINKFSLYLVYLAIGTLFAAFLEGFCWTRTGERQASRIRRKYLKGVLRQDVGFVDTNAATTTTSQVVNSVSNDTLVIQDVLSEKIPIFLMNISCFLSAYFVGFFLNWRLAVVTFPLLIFLIIPGIMYGRILSEISAKKYHDYNIAGDLVEQSISSIRTVFSFVGEERTLSRFTKALNGSVKLGIKQGLVKGIAVGSTGVMFLMWALVSWYGSILVINHGASGGNIFGAGITIIMGGLTLGAAFPNMRHISEACSAAQRVFEMIDRVPIINSDGMKGETLQEVCGKVEFINVKFAYPSRPETVIFENFSLTIPASKTLALVGRSGSGKSTTIALLERFYDPLAGEILFDGVNIKNLNLKWLRYQMGLVSQEPAVFATSIKENILFGKEEESSMDEVITAAQAANAHKFITQLPNGYDTQVGERGVQMSGGQKQRIAIARALLRNPAILVLDEATSALDADSENIVQDALDRASVGRTTLIIAHRLSTIRNADIIAVVNNGQVIESGERHDLICRENGAYAALVQLQEKEQRYDTSIAPTMTTKAVMTTLGSYTPVSGNTEQEKQNASSNSAPSLNRLLLLNASEWKEALLGCSAAIAFGAVNPTYAFILGSSIYAYFSEDHQEIKSKTKTNSLIFLSLGVYSLLVNVVQHYSFAVMGEKLTKRVREQMLSKILTFEVGWFDEDQNSSGALCSRLAKDANVVRSLVGDRLSLVLNTLSAVGISFALSLIVAWRLAIVLIAVQPLMVACFYSKKIILQKMSKKAMKSQGEGSRVASEAVGNHRTITAFSSQRKILRMFEKTQEGPHRDGMNQSWIAGLALGASQFVSYSNKALTFWYGGYLVYKQQIAAKDVFTAFTILTSTARAIADAGSMTSDIAKGSDAVESVFEILDRESRINPQDKNGKKSDKIEGHIDVVQVDFAYPCRPEVMIFKNFCFSIEAGTTVALVGESGSGKSTIIGLIERFYDPLEGMVKIDGKDIRTFNLRSLRQHIGLVGQEPTLFSGTIRDNICYGKENATEAEMIEAAKAANAHDFISCLKDGYDTESGDRGVQISGGQKQRIAIARAIIKNPSILLLDEATSALDTESEKMVQEALDRMMTGRTCVIIAHRLATIQNADSIAVIKDGGVIEEGNHSVLMSKGYRSSYFTLVNMQRSCER
ncbi:hypothetical protein KI387_016125 [Taxus chinensis]|uniref:Uncharacterized protein n=1 Tax=Taxus chinensis TaxID=29808 RepID=A0AA38LF10_TAXCH|nr:hypothetical protein KI387_016125 [Taxus chinensis]